MILMEQCIYLRVFKVLLSYYFIEFYNGTTWDQKNLLIYGVLIYRIYLLQDGPKLRCHCHRVFERLQSKFNFLPKERLHSKKNLSETVRYSVLCVARRVDSYRMPLSEHRYQYLAPNL